MVRYEHEDDVIRILGARNNVEGVDAEYAYVAEQHGERCRAWDLDHQSLLEREGRYYDELVVTLAGGEKQTYRFDITDFFGKW